MYVDQEYSMDILGRITQLNNERDWNAYKLSKFSGIPQSTISAWYSKNMTPTLPTVELLCKAYGITMAQFFLTSKERLDLTDDQKHLLQKWDTLSPPDKEHIFTIMGWMLDQEAK